MQITGGLSIVGGTTITNPVVILSLLSGDANVSIGTTVEWSSNTWLYLAEGQSNVAAQDYTTDTNNIVWQLFYAHKSIKLPVSQGNVDYVGGGGARWSTITRENGANEITLYGAIGGEGANKTNFKSNTDTVIATANYLVYPQANAAALYPGNITTQFVVPENRFFMLGFSSGPFYKNYRRTANNYTAVNGGMPIFTVLNEVYSGNWPTGPIRGIPNLFGGNTTNFTKLTSNILLSAVKFEVV